MHDDDDDDGQTNVAAWASTSGRFCFQVTALKAEAVKLQPHGFTDSHTMQEKIICTTIGFIVAIM